MQQSGIRVLRVAVGSTADIAATHAQPWLERATFTLTEDLAEDVVRELGPRFVRDGDYLGSGGFGAIAVCVSALRLAS